MRSGEIKSALVDLNAGNPQGSVLSPLLFLIYVNDIPDDPLGQVSKTQFADDMANIATDRNQNRVKIRLQKSLNLLEEWCCKWRVKLNAAKSQLILLGSKNTTNFSLFLFGQEIFPQQEATLLGFTFDRKMTMKHQVCNIQTKVNKRLGLLKMLRGKGWGANPQTLLKLYKSYIRPVIDYGSILTAGCAPIQMKKLQILQNKALRIVLSLPRHTPIRELHQLCNIEMISDRLQKLKQDSLQRFGESKLMQDLAKETIHFQ